MVRKVDSTVRCGIIFPAVLLDNQNTSMFTTIFGEGLSLTSSAELFVKQRLQMVDARQKFRESQGQGASSSMDELTDYLERAKDYVSEAKESAKEYLCNAKDYFYSNMQTDSIIQTTNKAQSEAEYPAYGLTGPSSQVASNMTNGDRKLAQSAQMYHYQHQKQQMIAMEKREKGEVQGNAESDYDSEEENEDGDLTVYECPGLAPTGEMQVKNPLFTEDHRSEASSQPEEKQ